MVFLVFLRFVIQEEKHVRVSCACRDKKAEGSGGAAASAGTGILYWLRQDFRLHDNPALCAAAAAAKRAGGKLTFVYVCSLEEDGDDLETGGHA